MDFLNLSKQRYSCRKFTDAIVEAEKIEKLVEVIHISPTAKNQQPLRAWIIQTPKQLDKIKEITPYHYDAPLSIAIGYVEEEAWIRESDNKNHGIVDASIAASNVWLEATDLNLGCVWVSAFDTAKQIQLFPEMGGCEIVAFMQIGYAAEDATPSKSHTNKRPKSEMFSYI